MPKTKDAIAKAARDIANQWGGDTGAGTVSVPRIFWELPIEVKKETVYTAVALVYPGCSFSWGRDCITGPLSALTTDISGLYLGNNLFVEVCDHVLFFKYCNRRTIQGSGKRILGRMLVAARGTATVEAGQRLAGSMRAIRRKPGVYLMLVSVRTRAKPQTSALLVLRPFVVMPKPLAGRGAGAQPSPPTQR
jgi:hypothetical protein